MIAQLQGHREGVSSLNPSPSGNFVCSTSGDGTAIVWNLETFQPSAQLMFHREGVNNSTFVDQNDALLMTCSDDRTVCFWDLRVSPQPIRVIEKFGDGINKVVAHRGSLISAVDDGLVYVHDMANGTLIDKFWVATNTVNDIVVDPRNASVLLTCSEDCAVRTWRLGGPSEATTEDRLLASFDEFENPVNHIGIRGNWIYAACSECVFASEYCDGIFGTSAKVFSCHTDYVRGIEFYTGSQTMFTSSDDSTVVEWNLETCEPLRQCKVHDEFVMALTLIETGDRDVLITGSEDTSIRLWRLPFATESFGESQ